MDIEIGSPWPYPLDVEFAGRWAVLRHGGASSHRWRGWIDDFLGPGPWAYAPYARESFERAASYMRQGGVVLIDPGGVVRAYQWAPRLRTRW